MWNASEHNATSVVPDVSDCESEFYLYPENTIDDKPLVIPYALVRFLDKIVVKMYAWTAEVTCLQAEKHSLIPNCRNFEGIVLKYAPHSNAPEWGF